MSEIPPHPYYRACQIVLALFFVAFAIVYGGMCVEHGKIRKDKAGNDFTAFYSAGEQARLGRNIYDWQNTSVSHRPFEYPPFFAVFPMMPLSALPFNTALAVFYALNAILLAASLWMLRKLLWPPLSAYGPGARVCALPLAGILLALALTWRFIHANTIESNANLYQLFLLTLALYFDRLWRQGGRAGALGGLACGMTVALGTAIKVTPALFGVDFLWTRRVWSMLGGLLGLLLWLVVVPGIFLGWETNLKYLDAYNNFALGKTLGTEQAGAGDPDRIVIGRPRPLDPNDSDSPQGVGVSLRGVLTSLLTPSPALRRSKDFPNRARTVNIAALEPRQVGIIAGILSLMVVLATVALTYGPQSREGKFGAALAWSLVTVTMTLISPLTRIAHLVVLAIPVATLIALLQQKRLSGLAGVTAWVALSLLILNSMTGEYLHAIGFTTFSLIVLYAALAAASVKLRRDGTDILM